MTRSDIEALKRGERAAQELFLCRHAEGVFSLIVRMVGNVQDAEELTQDTMLKALSAIDSYDQRRASLDTWLCHIAYRTALNHLRRPSVETIALDDDRLDVSDGAIDDALQTTDAAMAALVLQAIEHLPPDEQTLINLFYYDDLPLKDISYIVEAPPGTIATRLHRIRKRLYHIILKLQRQ